MHKPANQKPRDIAAEKYGRRFGTLPPLLYIGHLTDDDFIALIEAALRAGKPIAVDDMDAIADRQTLL